MVDLQGLLRKAFVVFASRSSNAFLTRATALADEVGLLALCRRCSRLVVGASGLFAAPVIRHLGQSPAHGRVRCAHAPGPLRLPQASLASLPRPDRLWGNDRTGAICHRVATRGWAGFAGRWSGNRWGDSLADRCSRDRDGAQPTIGSCQLQHAPRSCLGLSQVMHSHRWTALGAPTIPPRACSRLAVRSMSRPWSPPTHKAFSPGTARGNPFSGGAPIRAWCCGRGPFACTVRCARR